MEGLVRDALSAPIRITVGEVGAANTDIKQTVEVRPPPTRARPSLSICQMGGQAVLRMIAPSGCTACQPCAWAWAMHDHVAA